MAYSQLYLYASKVSDKSVLLVSTEYKLVQVYSEWFTFTTRCTVVEENFWHIRNMREELDIL